MKKQHTIIRLAFVFVTVCMSFGLLFASYPVVDTNQSDCFSTDAVIDPPAPGETFYGQDAQYQGNQPSYSDNGDGTVTDNITGLMWKQNMGDKVTLEEAYQLAAESTFAGYDDWRVPTIKELYSLIDFSGYCSGADGDSTEYIKFIDEEYFNQPFGDPSAGERLIDAQVWSSNEYVANTGGPQDLCFGVNFIDGRIKGYPIIRPENGQPFELFCRLVRGNPLYGQNDFVDNGDGTVTDYATGLMWQQADDGQTRDWIDALSYAENLELAGYDDWRLPNVKELQSIVDYSRAPDVTGSAAIDPVFGCTEIVDPAGNPGQYPYYWSSTTHEDGQNRYFQASYVAFGEGQGMMFGQLIDIHGAGCQRSDPKTGDPDDYPQFFGPQGDVRYVFNYVRCVRYVDSTDSDEHEVPKKQSSIKVDQYPNPFNPETTIRYTLDTAQPVRMDIYNVRGQKVRNLVTGYREAGVHEVVWNGKNHADKPVSHGVFFCRISTPEERLVRKMIMMK